MGSAIPGWQAFLGCQSPLEGSFLVSLLCRHSLLVVFVVWETLVLVESFCSCPAWCGRCHLCPRPSETFERLEIDILLFVEFGQPLCQSKQRICFILLLRIEYQSLINKRERKKHPIKTCNPGSFVPTKASMLHCSLLLELYISIILWMKKLCFVLPT